MKSYTAVVTFLQFQIQACFTILFVFHSRYAIVFHPRTCWAL